MECNMPLGRWDSACRRVGRRGRVGWRREDVGIAVVGEWVIGKIGIGANLWVVCGEAGH
jgi:hypothetical protein